MPPVEEFPTARVEAFSDVVLVFSLLIAIYFSLPPRLWAKKSGCGKPARINA